MGEIRGCSEQCKQLHDGNYEDKGKREGKRK